MRFDLIDEYSTLVPFGLGVSKRNRVIQYPEAATEAVTAVKPGAIANWFSSLYFAPIRDSTWPDRRTRRI